MSDRPRKRRYRPLSVKLSVERMPEALASMRRELTNLIRETAMDEPPAVAARLREIADLFDAGLSEDP
jgi:hypothetical protein